MERKYTAQLEILVQQQFEESLLVHQNASERLTAVTADAGVLLIQALEQRGKILVCGNGGSAADAQHFAAELVNRYRRPRVPLPAIALTTDSSALTAIGNDESFDQIFSKQIEALGCSGDILMALSTSGRSANILRAIEAAHKAEMQIIAFSGGDGGMMPRMLQHDDIELRVPSPMTPRIQEVHILLLHILCELIDEHFAIAQK